jgi:hypothetical protein
MSTIVNCRRGSVTARFSDLAPEARKNVAPAARPGFGSLVTAAP